MFTNRREGLLAGRLVSEANMYLTHLGHVEVVICREKKSYTAAFLKPVLGRGGKRKRRVEAAE